GTRYAVCEQPQPIVRDRCKMRPSFVGSGLSRTLLFAVLAVATPLAQQPAATGIAAANEWRQFRGSLRQTGVSASGPSATLKLLWTYDAGEIVESSAAIVDGVVYVGSGDGDLLALDLASGALRWKYTTGNLIGESSPAVGSGVVYIGDLGGLVHAVNV